MKSTAESVGENRRATFGFHNKLESVLSSATIYAILVFILLNIMLLMVNGPYHRKNKSQTSDDSLAKLRQSVFDSAYEINQSGPWPWWVARAYLDNSPNSISAPDIVIMGDSQANAAIIQADAVAMNKSMDCTTDRGCISLKKALIQQDITPAGTNWRLVNLSIGGAMPSDYYLMSKSLFTKNQHPKLIIITVSPRSFLDATLPAASATEIFQFFNPYVDLGNLVDYTFDNPAQKWFWLAQRKFALFACRQDINLAVHEFMENCLCKLYPKKSNGLQDQNDTAKRQSAVQSIYTANGLIPVGSSVVGPVPLLTFLDNKKEYSRRFGQMKPDTLTAQSSFMLATLKYLREINVPVIVIDMPMLEPVKILLPAEFWDKYRLGLTNNCIANNAHWLDLDANPEFPQNEFLDYVHLNAIGGKHFVNRVASFIKSDDSLSSCLQ